MKNYELMTEAINPCGGNKHAVKTFIEVACESAEQYAKDNSPFPIMEVSHLPNGDIVILTGDGRGYFVRFTFSE